MAAYKGYEPVIGVEVHCELKTASKVFCGCSAAFGNAPNTACCPVCMGLPGALPQLNDQAVRLTVQAGLALHCDIHRTAWFDRKNYFYPDLPKGYQITQNDTPFCTGGYVTLYNMGEKRISLQRIHLEEDAGKLLHRDGMTCIDYNRCGVGLIEIVSEPELSDPAEVREYLTELRQTLLFAGVSDCRMNEGSMRCEVNISVRPVGSQTRGVRCEIKNIGSIQFAARAAEEEFHRQADILAAGGVIEQETRRFNENTGKTETMRKKESAVDYRYFTEPNIPPVHLSEAYIAEIERQMPKNAVSWKNSLKSAFGLPDEDVEQLIQTPLIAQFYEKAASASRYPKLTANLCIGEVIPQLQEGEAIPMAPEHLAEAADLLGDGEVNSTVAKQLTGRALRDGVSPAAAAKAEGLFRIREESVLLPLVHEAIEADPRSVGDFLKGKTAAKKRLLGWVIRQTGGRADAAVTEALLDKALSELPQN
ncbi:MAG: Asp-tRNA(Asn)/Glu-tRNA(Gln) amidotransferase subunit GatB [Clostridia bacterium]|nr:Asp-tRNA(Asn)/Glu-tRNA(Gln) amidotransferase subunit GatB [Clostridia bacterium]